MNKTDNFIGELLDQLKIPMPTWQRDLLATALTKAIDERVEKALQEHRLLTHGDTE